MFTDRFSNVHIGVIYALIPTTILTEIRPLWEGA